MKEPRQTSVLEAAVMQSALPNKSVLISKICIISYAYFQIEIAFQMKPFLRNFQHQVAIQISIPVEIYE